MALLRMGFAEPHRSPGVLVVSYTTLSPSPHRSAAVYFLWHLPAGHPGWALPTILPCGVRTFLGTDRSVTRPPGRLIHPPWYRPGAAQLSVVRISTRRSTSKVLWYTPTPRRSRSPR